MHSGESLRAQFASCADGFASVARDISTVQATLPEDLRLRELDFRAGWFVCCGVRNGMLTVPEIVDAVAEAEATTEAGRLTDADLISLRGLFGRVVEIAYWLEPDRFPYFSGLSEHVASVRNDTSDRGELATEFRRTEMHERADICRVLADLLETRTPTDGASTQVMNAVPERTRSKGMTWQKARDAALKYLRTEGKPWSTVNALAKSIGCSPSTLRKACKRDAELAKIRRDAEQQASKSRCERPMPDAVRDGLSACAELDDIGIDVSTLTGDQSDDLIARLKAECTTPESMKQFSEMTKDQRLKVAMEAFSDPDTGRDTRSRGERARAR